MTRRALPMLRTALPLALLAVLVLGCPSPEPEPAPPPPPAEPPPQAAAGEGEMCGGIAGISCEEGLWCDPEPGLCEGADVAGTCIQVPEACTEEYAPVCGCDGQTYGNDCQRQAAQVAKNHDGECEAASAEGDDVHS